MAGELKDLDELRAWIAALDAGVGPEQIEATLAKPPADRPLTIRVDKHRAHQPAKDGSYPGGPAYASVLIQWWSAEGVEHHFPFEIILPEPPNDPDPLHQLRHAEDPS